MNIISCPQIVDNFLNKEKGLTRFVSILFNQVGDTIGIRLGLFNDLLRSYAIFYHL